MSLLELDHRERIGWGMRRWHALRKALGYREAKDLLGMERSDSARKRAAARFYLECRGLDSLLRENFV